MTQPSLFDAEVLPHFEHTRGDWLTLARDTARHIARTGNGTATIDQVRAQCPPPDDVDPRVMGAVFARSQWECVGYRKSERKESQKTLWKQCSAAFVCLIFLTPKETTSV